MISRRDVSPGFVKAVRWFTRILWFLMLAALIAAINYGKEESNAADKFKKERDELQKELDELKQAAADVEGGAKENKKTKHDGRTIP